MTWYIDVAKARPGLVPHLSAQGWPGQQERNRGEEEYQISAQPAPIRGGTPPGDLPLCEEACNKKNV